MFPFVKSTTSADDGERGGRLRLLLIVGGALIGILLLLFGSGTFDTEDEPIEEPSVYSPAKDELILYQTHLENRIRSLCESVRGVGRVSVFVSLESGFESVYAIEEEDGGEKYVIVGSGSSSEALFITRAAPEVLGIGVVCTGGDNANVRQELISLLCATFRLPSNRIYVTCGAE